MALEEDDPKLRFVDGGLCANNPSVEAWESIKQLNRGDPKTVDINVSIGTGRMLDSSLKKATRNGLRRKLSLIWNMLTWPTDTYAAHENMAQYSQDHGFQYYRLNVKNGSNNMSVDAWKGKRGIKTLEKLRTETQEYLDSDEAQASLKKALSIFSKSAGTEVTSLIKTTGNALVMGWNTTAASHRAVITGISTGSKGTSGDIYRRPIRGAITQKPGLIGAKGIRTAGWQIDATYESLR